MTPRERLERIAARLRAAPLGKRPRPGTQRALATIGRGDDKRRAARRGVQ